VRSGVWGIFARSAVTRGSHCRGSASRLRVMPALRGQPPSKIPQGGPILPGRYAAGAPRIASTRRGSRLDLGVGVYLCGEKDNRGSLSRGSASRFGVMPALFIFIHS
jgi:hypothetical protein